MSSNLDFPDSVCGIIEDSGFTTSTKMLELNCKSHLPKGMPVEVFKIFADNLRDESAFFFHKFP